MTDAPHPCRTRAYGRAAGGWRRRLASPVVRTVRKGLPHGRPCSTGNAGGMKRRTKIVATIGPASERPEAVRAMAAAGMNVARVTLAHGTTEEAVQRIRMLR